MRFVVVDLVSCGIPAEVARELWVAGKQTPATDNLRRLPEEFPWNYSVVFRTGTYLVLAVPPAGETRLVDQTSLETAY